MGLLLLHPHLLAVEEEGAEAGGVHLVGNEDKEIRVEFKGAGELVEDLINALKKLHKHRRLLVVGILLGAIAQALHKLVAKGGPLLLDEDAEAAEGAVVGVHEEHGERGELGGAVPPVAAVDQHRRPLPVHQVHHLHRHLHHQVDELWPPRLFQPREPVSVISLGRAALPQLLEALPDHVDVGDVQEEDRCVLVDLCAFIPCPHGLVHHRVHLGACVGNKQARIRGIGVLDRLDQGLIMLVPPPQTAHLGLAAPGDGGLVLRVKPRKHRKPVAGPEFGRTLQDGIIHRRRDCQDGRVGGTELEIRVRIGHPPVARGAYDPLELLGGLVDVPAVHLELLLVGEGKEGAVTGDREGKGSEMLVDCPPRMLLRDEAKPEGPKILARDLQSVRVLLAI